MAMEKTTSRVAMALMCGLAICCAVMYLTADGAESVHEDRTYAYSIKGPTSVESEDVEKAGSVWTNTPDGRMLLSDYLSNVEAEIAAEEAARKHDVEAVREQMARNAAFNQAARDSMKKALLAKMAANAKKAKRDLDRAMRFVQKKFHDAASLQNKRNTANLKRSAKLRTTIAANKAEAHKNLETAVLAQQRSQAAVASAVNARIDKTNKHVAANAAQIKENAKKAREELDAAVAMFDTKVANAREEAKAGRSKLATQLADQDKSLRQWANNKMKKVIAETQAQFRRVRQKMADDRHHADLQLKGASSRMFAALNANAALNDKRFKQTVSDIATAKAEAEARVSQAEVVFKASLNKLSTTVNEQTQRLHRRITQLTNKVENIKVAQAAQNSHVDAESKRMVKLGNDRYQEHLKKDAELKALIDSNKAATKSRMDAMAAHYTGEIRAVRATMKKNRAYAAKRLAQETSKLYGAIAKGEAEQLKVNGALAEQTRAAEADIAAALSEAKDDFAERLGSLHKVVVDNDKKFEGKMDKLTGIVRSNAVKNAQERQILNDQMEANKQELTAAIREAVTLGETRMAKAETMLLKLNDETKAALNMKITSEISKLTKRANSQIEGLRLNSKEARDEMRKELLFAVREMADEAKKNLDAAKEDMEKSFGDAAAKEKAAADAAAADRAKVAQEAADMKANAELEVNGAVNQMHKALIALKAQTRAKIKKTNQRVDAYGLQVQKEAEEVKAIMKQQMDTLLGEIEAQKTQAKEAIGAANDESAAQWVVVQDEVASSFEKYEKKAVSKHEDLMIEVAEQRADLDKKLAASVQAMNDAIAKQAAINDGRFAHTVKDIKAAREEASAETAAARQDFSTGLVTLDMKISEMDEFLTREIQNVAGILADHKVTQGIVNRHVQAEISRIQHLMNTQFSESKRARGKLRQIMDLFKQQAHEEVQALAAVFKDKIQKIKDHNQADFEAASSDLQAATTEAYERMAAAQEVQIYANQVAASNIEEYGTSAADAIKKSKEDFTSRLDWLSDVVGKNHNWVLQEFEQLTNVVNEHKATGERERGLIRQQNEAMGANMRRAIQAAVQAGEARAKGVAKQAREDLAKVKSALLNQITETVEEWADATFKTVQGGFTQIADNYLSLKAYAVTAEQEIVNYVGKGKGKNLSSLGDLLVNIAAVADVKPQKSEGVFAGDEGSTITSVFSNDKITIDAGVSEVNGLVYEFVGIAHGVRERWPMGLGKYLLSKLEDSMKGSGCLQVDKITQKSGNWVFINGHAVGLSNKLNDFESLAVRMQHYEATLAKLTAEISGKKAQPAKPGFYLPKPEWSGD